VDIIKIYNQYLEQKNRQNGIYRKQIAEKRYSASGSGMCLRKHYYNVNDYGRLPIDDKSLRTLRLGTVFGQDVEHAMKWHNINQHGITSEHATIETEEFVEHPTLPICGHFDILVVDENRKGQLIDIKTANTWKYQGIFGRKKDPNPSTNYQMQLGTYAWLLNETKDLCDEVTSMELIYFNKNDARMQSANVPLEFIGIAEDYWEMLFANNGNLPPIGQMVPAYDWECGKYCDFRHICDSPLIKEKDKPKITKHKEALIA
tara:strand:- start:2242 stop:3021 length:780 start_codon:yes stop_codon:yes gene_type:complete